MHFSSILDKP